MPPGTKKIEFTLDGKAVSANEGETILAAAARYGVEIPRLCDLKGYRPDGNCRVCVVEIEGERALAPSCCRVPAPGMKVRTDSERAVKSRRLVLELLLADMPDEGLKWVDGDPARGHGELSYWAHKLGVKARPELKALRRARPAADLSHPAMAVNLDACIQCKRCVRACREEQVNDVIGYAARGARSEIVFDQRDPMGHSTCVGCGECVQSCPTGALMPKGLIGSQEVDRKVPSVCPWCGVGCQVTFNVKDNRILSVDGRDGPANRGRLCVKGRFGMDYVQSPQRLTRPLIRRPGVPKEAAHGSGPADWTKIFREAGWEEALDFAASGLRRLRDKHGKKALAGFGSAKGSNEEAYLFQKLVRTGFGSNNVDHCTRLCHASSVAGLLEGIGSGAVSNQVNDAANSDFIVVIGSNPTVNHPVAATWIKNAAKRGARLLLCEPRRTELNRYAWRTLQLRPDTDIALLNAMLHTVIEEGLYDRKFVAERVNNFSAIRENVKACSPEAMAPVCGIPPAAIREAARAYAGARAAIIFWGMGISQHVHGTDNTRCLIALCAVCGQIGKPGAGLHPLRGQNNVQGASDSGLIPMMYPNYRRVNDPAARKWFEEYWRTPLDDKPGYTVVEVIGKITAPEEDQHKIRGMYIMGENPAMSDPDLAHARAALAKLGHLVVQDIFMTETAQLADVVLPASAWPEKTGTVNNTDRMVQLGRRAVDPPGEARQDLWIIQELARRLGLAWDYRGPESGVAEVYEELRRAMPTAIGGITWERLEREGCVTYPCLSPEDPGSPTVFKDRFPTADGRANLVPARLPAHQVTDGEYPFALITGRQLEHWHTGSMTRRSPVLNALEPAATVTLCGEDLERLGVTPGETVTVTSRQGSVALRARRDDGNAPGTVFIPFAYYEAAANLLTDPALDPFGKIPEFKYTPVAVRKGGTAEPGGYLGE